MKQTGKKMAKLILFSCVCLCVLILTLWLSLKVFFREPYPISRNEFYHQTKQLTPGMTKQEVEAFLKGVNDIQTREDETRYYMLPDKETFTLYPALKLVIIVEYDENNQVVHTVFADL